MLVIVAIVALLFGIGLAMVSICEGENAYMAAGLLLMICSLVAILRIAFGVITCS